jgi:putative glutamine amidotransferase
MNIVAAQGASDRATADPPRPVVGVICCTRRDGDHPVHAVVEKYVMAAARGADALPLLVPALDQAYAEDAVARLDGLLAPGSRSNVEPRHYGGPTSPPETPHDPARDSMALPLLRAAVAADLPVLAICRGIQELNVAMGGTLHQQLHAMPGRLDHRARKELPFDERYGQPAHPVALTPGGLFERLAQAREISVNSLHGQGIDRLAPGLVVEATAPDGTIEAVRLATARFIVGVQWHPEYRLEHDPFSRALFAAFGAACRAYAARPFSR